MLLNRGGNRSWKLEEFADSHIIGEGDRWDWVGKARERIGHLGFEWALATQGEATKSRHQHHLEMWEISGSVYPDLIVSIVL